MSQEISQTEWDDLKEFHNIDSDADLHEFLLGYVASVHLVLTPNQASVLRRILLEYIPDYDEASTVKDLTAKLG